MVPALPDSLDSRLVLADSHQVAEDKAVPDTAALASGSPDSPVVAADVAAVADVADVAAAGADLAVAGPLQELEAAEAVHLESALFAHRHEAAT